MMALRLALLTLVSAMSVTLPGCASVAPWERGNLAKPQMALDHDPAQTEVRSHVYSAREAAASSSASAGGGCGCY